METDKIVVKDLLKKGLRKMLKIIKKIHAKHELVIEASLHVRRRFVVLVTTQYLQLICGIKKL